MSDAPRERAFHERPDETEPSSDEQEQVADERPSDDRSEADDSAVDEQEKALGEPTAISAASMAVEIAELKADLETLKDEADNRLVGWQRAQADLENYKKHSIQDLAERVRLAKSGVLLDLLAVVDDFERALAADHESDTRAWIEGVRLIEKKFYSFLEAKNLSPIAAEHQRFDPNFHEALGQAPGPAGQILVQLHKGYLLGDKVLRPSRVIVGSGDDPGASPATDAAQAKAKAEAAADEENDSASPEDVSESS